MAPPRTSTKSWAEKSRIYNLKRAAFRRAFLSMWKAAEGCKDCGYNDFAGALQFDHIPEYGKKTTAIPRLIAGSRWTNIFAEIMKCEVVCANCHAKRTSMRLKRVVP